MIKEKEIDTEPGMVLRPSRHLLVLRRLPYIVADVNQDRTEIVVRCRHVLDEGSGKRRVAPRSVERHVPRLC